MLFRHLDVCLDGRLVVLLRHLDVCLDGRLVVLLRHLDGLGKSSRLLDDLTGKTSMAALLKTNFFFFLSGSGTVVIE